MNKIILKKNEDRRIRAGHYWAFSNEIDKIEGAPETGELIDIFDSKNVKLGTGFYNKSSLIAARLLERSYSGDIAEYIKRQIHRANNYRKNIYPGRNSYRLIFSEGDYLPGLIIDKYNDSYVLQVYCAGMQQNISQVTDLLKNDLGAVNIFTRNDPYYRKLEGLPEADEVFLGSIGNEVIYDGKLSYSIDFSNSQKTGFYFDQCDNREFIEKISAGKTVLDAFSNSGGFGMHAASVEAVSVTFLDSSAGEIENAKSNFTLNKLSAKAEFVVSDVFDYFEKCISTNIKFDLVMVDPPAFAKSRKSIPTAIKGYSKLNKLALQCINNNGYLVSSSCSYHVKEKDFIDAINKSAEKTGKSIQLIYKNGASLDHPQIPAMEETSYLNFLIFLITA
jgi:23S rRNA (cytosine1962-C5)-methyltransferase